MSEVTLLFHEDHLMASASLTLTVMLVMYTMYQSIRGDMTETAYLQMIDYWLLFCLLMPFIIFMIEIYWILKKANPEKFKNWRYRKILDQVLKERFVKIFVPSITCLFMLSYTCAAVVIRNFQPWAMNVKQEYIMSALQVLRKVIFPQLRALLGRS